MPVVRSTKRSSINADVTCRTELGSGEITEGRAGPLGVFAMNSRFTLTL